MSSFFIPSSTYKASGSNGTNKAKPTAVNQGSRSMQFANGTRGPSYSINDDDEDIDEGEGGKETVIGELMRAWENKYCDYTDLYVFVGTFNVNGQPPPSSARALAPWLSDGLTRPPDIYSVGFQELDLSQQAFLFDSTPREQEWAKKVKDSLHPEAEYCEILRHRLVGMLLLVYVRKPLLAVVSVPTCSTNAVGTGILNRLGNKGGVAASVHVQDTRLCFVNSHLAAGSDELTRRNQDFREISRLNFPQAPSGRGAHPVPLNIFDHDAVVWLGDLNYRLQSHNLDINTVKKKSACNDLKGLLARDQLRVMQQSKTAWHDFTEGEITFLPTYKYDPGTDNWDSSEKARVPAWCDRVLWVAGKTAVRQERYASVVDIRISDHKPVLATFDISVKRVDPVRYQKHYEQALFEGDRRANEALPQISIDRIEFDFGAVKFLDPRVLTLTMKNTGLFPVQFRFKRRPGLKRICKPFITITPYAQRIDVGKECMVDIQVLIDKEAAWRINDQLDTLDDVLVLHLQNGRDYFLLVKGEYLNSCFGRSLQSLMNTAKERPLIDFGDTSLHEDSTLASPYHGVPKQLYRLVEYVKLYGLDQPDLFSQAGSHQDFSRIRDVLDSNNNEDFSMASSRGVHSVVEAMLRFLDSLPEPIIPVKFTNVCLAMPTTSAIGARQVVSQLPEVHRLTFDYLIAFLGDVLKHSEQNGTTEEAICMLFAPILFRLSDDDGAGDTGNNSFPTEAQIVKNRQRQQQAMTFIQNCLVRAEETCSVSATSVSGKLSKTDWHHFS